jgi:uncharacterized membrane protein YhaH (DUF805 family)
MPRKDIIAEAKRQQKRDPFWLLIMAVLILIAVILLVEKARFAIILVVGIVLCYLLYRNPFGEKT